MHPIDLRRIDLNLLVVFEVLMSERSVTRAAERLGRTQSAVSHALARLRRQLGDPVLVKSGTGMQASAFAVELIEQVRPILRTARRVLGPRQEFDAATSHRTFRLALPDLASALFPRLLELVRARSPGVVLEWTRYQQDMLLGVVDGQIDLALGPSDLRLPDGIATAPMGSLRWCCFGRHRHPAFARWGKKAWSRWPHVMVGLGDRLSNPVRDAAAAAGVHRTIAAHVPHFAAVPPLLAKSDLLATLPAIVMVDVARRYDVTAMPVPFAIHPMPHDLLWSARLTNDPAIVWLRDCLRQAIGEVFTTSELVLDHREARPGRRRAAAPRAVQ